MTRLLVVEDDIELREAPVELLRGSGYEVVAYADGTVTYEALENRRFDLAIIDWMRPGRSGLDVVRELRQQSSKLPILIVSACHSVADRVTGLDVGADDYLVKPFQMPELEARVRALLRRMAVDAATPIQVGPLTLLPGEPRVRLDGATVVLPPREFALLELLAARAGGVVSKRVIGARMARRGEPPTNTAIETCIHRLRRRLVPFGLKIRAQRGFGYVLEPP